MSEPRVALVWGDSGFLLREAARELLGDLQPVEVDARAWRPGLVSDLSSPSLFGEDRALLVTGAEALPQEARAEIAAHAADPPPSTHLVLTAEVGPRAKGPPRSLAKALGDRATVRRATVDRRDLPGWVRERAAARGIRATAAGAAALVRAVGEEPGGLDQALQQVSASHGELTPESVAAQFRGFGDRRVWEVTDAAFAGDGPGALRALVGLLAAREEPLAILGGIAARLRDLIRVRALPPRMPPAQVAREAGLRFDWQARRYREQVRRFPPGELEALHETLIEADRALKQGAAGDVVLPMVVTRIVAAS